METTANCGVCTRRLSQDGGDASCVIRELYEARKKLAQHDCHGFRPKKQRQFSSKQMPPKKQRPDLLPEALF